MEWELINKQMGVILKKMVDLYLMFTVPTYIIPFTPGEIICEHRWVNEDAKKLYQDYETMLKMLKEEYEAKAAQNRHIDGKENTNRNDRKHKIS